MPKTVKKAGGLAVLPGDVGLYTVTAGGKVSTSPYCVQPASHDRAWMHKRAVFWLAADHDNNVVDGVMPEPRSKARSKARTPCTPYKGSWAEDMANRRGKAQ